MKNIIKGLSEKKKEEIIHMSLRELYQTGYDAGFADGQASTVEDATIEHEGKLLRKVDREAREGDYAMFGGLSKYYSEHYTENGKLYKVLNDGRYIGKNGTNYGVYNWSECPHPEIFEVVEGYNPQIPMYDEAIEPIPAPLTANQQRAELIQRAREFVEDLKREGGHYNVTDPGSRFPWDCNVDFIINEEKRTVIALMRGVESNKIRSKGIAKCMPGDVFNEWIGKAIALARALEIDIPQEFMEAVQPTEFAVGHVTKLDNFEPLTVVKVESDRARLCNGGFHWNREFNDRIVIIDDTNAIYESVGE